MNPVKPKISFFGPDFATAYINESLSYLRGILKYLGRMGYHITYYQPDKFDYPQVENLLKHPHIRLNTYREDPESLEKAIASAANGDILIKTSGIGRFDAFLERTLLDIRKARQKVIYWDLDPLSTLNSIYLENGSVSREFIPKYDHIVTNGGSENIRVIYKLLHGRDCIKIHNAVDPELYFKVKPEKNFEADLSFHGNRLPGMDEKMLEFFIKVAERMPDKKFLLTGIGWMKFTFPSNIRYIPHLPLRYHNVLNSSVKTVLDISAGSDTGYAYSPRGKVFEAAATGACIITDHWDSISGFFEPNAEVWVAENGRQLEELLKIPNSHARLKRAALTRVLEQHTYAQRAAQLDEILHEREVSIPMNKHAKLKSPRLRKTYNLFW